MYEIPIKMILDHYYSNRQLNQTSQIATFKPKKTFNFLRRPEETVYHPEERSKRQTSSLKDSSEPIKQHE
jgi:hypothetical protein